MKRKNREFYVFEFVLLGHSTTLVIYQNWDRILTSVLSPCQEKLLEISQYNNMYCCLQRIVLIE